MGYRLNRLDEPVFMAGPKLMPTEFDIHHRLDSCVHSMLGQKCFPSGLHNLYSCVYGTAFTRRMNE